ncbi:glucose repression mediator protein [Tulasnella sp. 417]|nr:glucose repression mediator protein [Tulasnella sp. 417]
MAHHPHSAGPPPLDHATLPPRSHHHHSSHHPPPPPQHAAPPPNGVPPHLPPPPSSHTPRHAHPPPPPPPSGGPPPQQPPPAAANGSGPMQVSPAASHHRPPTAGARPSSVRGGAGARSGFTSASLQRLAQSNEETWILLGNLAEQMNDPDRAENAYENALRHNPESERALTQVASIARSRDDFGKAIEFFQRALDVRQENGEVWSALGHCYLMQDDLQKAYAAYQQALYHLPNPKDPKLWYGIGILYDRYGSLDNAEEAFSSVLRMDANFEKAEEILFRLGIIYKQQQKYSESLDCFDRILRNPPAPLANLDIWFQIGHVYEQAKNYEQAKEAYERVLADSPNHAKVLQQLGWLYHQPGSSFVNQDMAIQCLTKSLEADSGDAQSWYLLGRAYMAVQKYQKAYEAYQQAVYRDGRNPTFWCSIGVLYYNINQYRDALDAYSRAIRINPYIPEVWFDLGSLYESCNNQISDAIDAYARAADLDPNNQVIKSRLRLLKDVQANGGTMPAAPGPQDVHPTAYASGHGPPSMLMGAAGSGGSGPGHQPPQHPHAHSRSNSRSRPSNGVDHPMNGGATRDLPAPSPSMRGGRRSAEYGRHPADEPFHGGAPPPLNIDDSAPRRGSGGHAPLAPMDVDRRDDSRRYPPPEGRDRSTNGPPPPPLHHPVPQPPIHGISDMAPPPPSGRDALPSMNSRAPYDPHDGPRGRRSPPDESPRSGNRRPAMSPPPSTPYNHQSAPYSRSSSNFPPTPQGLPPPITSAHHGLPYDRGTATSTAANERHDPPWERRHARNDSRNGMVDQPREFRSPAPPSNGPPSSAAYPPPHAARPPSAHSYDRRVPSPHVSRSEYPDRRDARSPPYPPSSSYWAQQHSPPQGHPAAPRRPSPPPAPPSSAPPSRRYDPRYDGEAPRREGWDRDRDVPASRHSEGPPPPLQQQQPPPPLHHPHHATSGRVDRSYNGTPELGSKSNGVPPPSSMSKPPPLESATQSAYMRDRGSESPPPTGTGRATAEPAKERKKRGGAKERDDAGTPKPVKEKKERKQPSKRGAGIKQGLVEQESDSRGSVAPMPEPQQLPPAPPFKAPSAHKTSPPQWTHSHSGTTTPSAPPPPPHVHRPSRSVDEDYDEEPEREDGHGGAAAALMGLAAGNGRSIPPPPTRTVSGGRLDHILNGSGPPSRSPTISTRGPIDRVRSPPPGRSGTPLKRGASSDETMEGERKRSRIDSNGSSSAASSPPVPSKLNSILSPTEQSSRGPPYSSQSRRASLDTRSDTQSRRSWADVEHERKVSSTSPSQNKPRSAPISPHALPPIATLSDSPSSPSASKGPARPGSPMHVDVPRVPSPVAESA